MLIGVRPSTWLVGTLLGGLMMFLKSNRHQGRLFNLGCRGVPASRAPLVAVHSRAQGGHSHCSGAKASHSCLRRLSRPPIRQAEGSNAAGYVLVAWSRATDRRGAKGSNCWCELTGTWPPSDLCGVLIGLCRGGMSTVRMPIGCFGLVAAGHCGCGIGSYT